MSYESSQFPGPNSELQATLKLLAEIESGAIESLECPRCHANMVSVWFTHPCPNEYRTWLICGNCEFRRRVQNSERPCIQWGHTYLVAKPDWCRHVRRIGSKYRMGIVCQFNQSEAIGEKASFGGGIGVVSTWWICQIQACHIKVGLFRTGPSSSRLPLFPPSCCSSHPGTRL